MEGVLFSSAFAAIFWLKTKNILKGVINSNEYISRDEAIHYEFAKLLYNDHTDKKEKLTENDALEIV